MFRVGARDQDLINIPRKKWKSINFIDVCCLKLEVKQLVDNRFCLGCLDNSN